MISNKMYLFNNFNLQKEQQMKKLMSLAMLVLLLGGSAATVIPNRTAQSATVAQTVQLSDEQLDGVQGGYGPDGTSCNIAQYYWQQSANGDWYQFIFGYLQGVWYMGYCLFVPY
ncbi:MAG: hypothetical protein HY22_06520 [[Candidatus Thermochlorobacteriaceae] bacterium GBChlB]|nr:MAG: hypothetical protein HY22_06520 [[Candidatus Thermochlorobacteriaceae] bacterium GBChlB]